ERAELLNLPIFQPDKIKKSENIEFLKQYDADVIVVVAYGQILSKEILEYPKFGCINVHASLLPNLRGAAPLNWAIINGNNKSGVTTMMMDIGLDTGDMLLKSEIDIDEHMCVGELHDKLMVMGAELLIETLNKVEKNELIPVKQDENLSSYAPMLDKNTQKINWNESAKSIHNLVRGLSPWPTAFFTMEDKNIKVYKSSVINENDNSEFEPGFIIKVDESGIHVKCKKGILVIEEIQMPGKNKMNMSAYLRGNKFPEKIILN
ncbi:MAG: methionyl-tRNA formyltransferase, partial [Bacillota bacterium]|nr:methionyl-tRNA formyltransferase [Bacillota bacterium]